MPRKKPSKLTPAQRRVWRALQGTPKSTTRDPWEQLDLGRQIHYMHQQRMINRHRLTELLHYHTWMTEQQLWQELIEDIQRYVEKRVQLESVCKINPLCDDHTEVIVLPRRRSRR